MHFAWTPRITDAEMTAFLAECLARAGADALITPREIIRDYMAVLNILYQNPEADFTAVVGKTLAPQPKPAASSAVPDDFSLSDIEL